MESMCGGGAEKVLTTLLSNLDSKRYAVSLLLLNATGPNISDLPDNVELIALNGENSFFIKHNLLFNPFITLIFVYKSAFRLYIRFSFTNSIFLL